MSSETVTAGPARDRLRAEIKAAMEPSDGDKEDLISLVLRREREAVDRSHQNSYWNRFRVTATNALGAYVPAIPLPFLGARKRCECGEKFWTMEGYKAHYALRHILYPADPSS